MADNLEFIFNLSNKMSPQLEKIIGEVQLLAKGTDKFNNIKITLNDSGIDKFNSKLKTTRGTMQYYKETLQRLEQGRDKAWRIDHIEKYNGMIAKARMNIERLNNMYGGKGETAQGGGIGTFIKGGLILGAVNKLFNYGKEAVLTGAKYEKYNAVYENALGSKDAARNRMGTMKNFASKTPFQISDLVGSDIKLQNRNINLNTGQLTNLGDLAASQGKGFDQLTEALLDAQTGEFERLKEFGIKASKEGDKVTFNFKNQEIAVKNTSDAITEAILAMGKYPGVAGGMAKISKTTEGAISNLGDSYEQMMAAIGQSRSGSVKDAILGLTGITDTVKGWFEIPVSEKLMAESAEMTALVAVAQDYTKTSDERNAALQQLQATYPEYFGNLTEEDVKLGKLKETLDKVNASYEKKIGLASAKELKQMTGENLANAQNDKNNLDFLIKMLEKAKSGDGNARTYLKNEKGWDNNLWMYEMGGADIQINQYKEKIKKLNDDIASYSYANDQASQDEKLAQFDIYAEKYKGKYDQLIEQVNAKDKEKFKALYLEYVTAMDPKSSQGRGRKEKAMDDALKLSGEMDAILNNKKSGVPGSAPGGSSATSAKSDAIIGGGAKPVNITVNISNLNGIETLSMNGTVKENSSEIGDAVMDVMLRAINGAVMMTGNNMR